MNSSNRLYATQNNKKNNRPIIWFSSRILLFDCVWFIFQFGWKLSEAFMCCPPITCSFQKIRIELLSSSSWSTMNILQINNVTFDRWQDKSDTWNLQTHRRTLLIRTIRRNARIYMKKKKKIDRTKMWPVFLIVVFSARAFGSFNLSTPRAICLSKTSSVKKIYASVYCDHSQYFGDELITFF